MKKLLSLAASLAICVSGMTAIVSNAEYTGTFGSSFVLVNDDDVYHYEPFDTWNDFLGLTSESDYYMYRCSDSKIDSLVCCLKKNVSPDDPFNFAGIWAYFESYTFKSEDEAAMLKDYLAENYPDFTATINATNPERFDVNISGEAYENLSREQKFTIAKDIRENTGFIPNIVMQDNTAKTGDVYSIGDTDMNSEVSINDAAQIMSFVTNKEQYPLSEMSQIVGDVYNTGDGINNMDALQIQRILANVD